MGNHRKSKFIAKHGYVVTLDSWVTKSSNVCSIRMLCRYRQLQKFTDKGTNRIMIRNHFHHTCCRVTLLIQLESHKLEIRQECYGQNIEVISVQSVCEPPTNVKTSIDELRIRTISPNSVFRSKKPAGQGNLSPSQSHVDRCTQATISWISWCPGHSQIFLLYLEAPLKCSISF